MYNAHVGVGPKSDCSLDAIFSTALVVVMFLDRSKPSGFTEIGLSVLSVLSEAEWRQNMKLSQLSQLSQLRDHDKGHDKH